MPRGGNTYPVAMKAVPEGQVRVHVRVTFPDGSDSWRAGRTDFKHAAHLGFKYTRACIAGYEFELVDHELPPDVATVDEMLIKELYTAGSQDPFGWKGRPGKEASPHNASKPS